MSDLDTIDSSISALDDMNIVRILLFGDKKYNFLTNQRILQLTITFLKATERFDNPLF